MKPAQPQIPSDLIQQTITGEILLDEYEEVSIGASQLSGAGAQSLHLSRSRLERVDATDSQLAHLHATDVELQACNFSNAKLPDAAFWRVALSGCKLSGTQMMRGTLIDVTFRNCRLDFASFTDVKFKNVTFEDCQMREIDFSKVTLENVAFVECDLTRAMFGRMKIQRVEMRRCTLSALRGLSELRGIAMESNDILAQAELFAAELGIAAIPNSGKDASADGTATERRPAGVIASWEPSHRA
jgi:uncharacterized protein YjbI with pentapeptide repeats